MDDKDLSSGGSVSGAGGDVREPSFVRVDEGYDRDKIYTSIRITSMVLYSLVCVLGVSGNGVVIWATGFRMKKTVSTVWYLNLAVADFLATAFQPLNITYNALGYHWPFGWFMCKMDGYMFFANYYASVYTLAVISVDRCVCVVCPVWARCSGHRTVRKASCVSLGVWVLALLLALALSTPLFMFSGTKPVGDKVRCYENYALVAVSDSISPEEYELHEFRFTTVLATRFVVGFVVPFSVIISCYSVIVYRLRTRPLVSLSGRSFKIIATVITMFFLCWLPIYIIWLIYSVNFKRLRDGGTLALVIEFGKPVTGALCLLNSCLNPLLYLFSQGFKGVFRRNVLKVLEKAFNEPADQRPAQAVTSQMSNTESKESPPGNQDPETVLSETVVEYRGVTI